MAAKSSAPAKAAKAAKGATKRTMGDAQKAAMAVGRDQGARVRRYLDALDANKPKRGRKRSPESIQRRLNAIAGALPGASTFEKVALNQEELDLKAELMNLSKKIDLSALEADFIAVAKEYGDRKGYTVAAWRSAGVPAAVLAKAGIGGLRSPRRAAAAAEPAKKAPAKKASAKKAASS